MKWIGQHIYDLVSRFRNDVYLEDISTGTIASGAHLGLDSSNKIVKAVDGGGDITSVTAGTGLSGGGTTGDVTLNVNVNHDSLAGFVAAEHVDWAGASAGTIHTTNIPLLNQDTSGTSVFSESAGQATILATTRAINGVDFNGSEPITITAAAGTLSGSGLKSTVTGSSLTSVGSITTGIWKGTAIASVYLDTDTAHLSGNQTFTGGKTFDPVGIVFDGDKNVTPGDGAVIHVNAHTVTDSNTSESGTAALYTHVHIESPRLAATNSSVTTTAAASLYINNAPAAHTNQTITNAYALWVDNGNVRFDGDVTGTLATAAQPNITTLAGLTSFGSAGATTNIVAGDLTMYNPVNDGNPRFSIGAASAESFYINPYYDSGAQTLNFADIGTNTADSGAHAGYLRFVVDGNPICGIFDDGIQLMSGAGLTIGNSTTGTVDIITDNGSGTTTLSNIDALDATTISTLNALPSRAANIYGSVIKILPSDFIVNDDGSNTKFGVGYVEDAGDSYGIRTGSNDAELFAFVSIPEGMEATEVEIFGRRAKAVAIYEVQINATTAAHNTSGFCTVPGGSSAKITLGTAVESTATNLLAIAVITTSNAADKVYGGAVTIAAI